MPGIASLHRHAAAAVLVLCSVCAGQQPLPEQEPAPEPAPSIDARYLTHAELAERVREIAAANPSFCIVESIGASREGHVIWAMRLAAPGETEPRRRSAILLVANIDGDHLLGSAVAVAVVELLLERVNGEDEAASRFLREHALYVVPRVNPDAAERFFADVKGQRRRNVRPDDLDRDAAIDEDPPNDLNGDGLITMMRVRDPEKADRMDDPGEPRLDVGPDRDKGQRAAFVVYTEGIDDDGDEEFNEDDLGGVDLNMNFMHGYKEHADGAGPHQVSEPESLALLEYVLERQNIAVVLTYGVHDNLSKVPDGKGSYPSGTPKTIDEKDVGLYTHIGERFTEITGLKKVPGEAPAGAFFEWAYAQFGVPSFTTPLWTRPEPAPEPDNEAGEQAGGGEAGPDKEQAAPEPADDGLTPSGIGDISQETMDELIAGAEARGFQVSDEMMAQITPSMVEGFARRMGVEIRRVKGDAAKAGAATNKQDTAWLKYSDEQRDGEGFVAWQAFDHPQLGEVEIGGWVPYFKINPPAAEIPGIAVKQLEFVLDLAGRLPDVSLTEPEVTRLAPGLYEVKAALVNDGYLPTGTAMAVKNRRARPYVVRLSVASEQVLTGQRVNKTWSIPGSGGRETFRWIIAAPDGAPVSITVYSEKFGEFETIVTLRDNQDAAQAGGDP